MNFGRGKSEIPLPGEFLPGREQKIAVPRRHFVNGAPLDGPFAESCAFAMFGMGCFWGAERLFWTVDGVVSTAVGYAGGGTPNPTYQEVCTGGTGHNEVVRVVFDPAGLEYVELLKIFWEGHDPTQGMRQGNDVGTQYRSGIYCFGDNQLVAAKHSREVYADRLRASKYGSVTTEVMVAPEFFFAEEYHQQYLAKNPGGYCGLGGTGVELECASVR